MTDIIEAAEREKHAKWLEDWAGDMRRHNGAVADPPRLERIAALLRQAADGMSEEQVRQLRGALDGLIKYVARCGKTDLPREYNEPPKEAPAVTRAKAVLQTAQPSVAMTDEELALLACGDMGAQEQMALAEKLEAMSLRGVPEGWSPMSLARKDRTIVWAALRSDLVAYTGRNDLERWQGVQVPVRHLGIADDGFDIGWSVAAPVGQGGFPDDWFAGWKPLPAAPLPGGARS